MTANRWCWWVVTSSLSLVVSAWGGACTGAIGDASPPSMSKAAIKKQVPFRATNATRAELGITHWRAVAYRNAAWVIDGLDAAGKEKFAIWVHVNRDKSIRWESRIQPGTMTIDAKGKTIEYSMPPEVSKYMHRYTVDMIRSMKARSYYDPWQSWQNVKDYAWASGKIFVGEELLHSQFGDAETDKQAMDLITSGAKEGAEAIQREVDNWSGKNSDSKSDSPATPDNAITTKDGDQGVTVTDPDGKSTTVPDPDGAPPVSDPSGTTPDPGGTPTSDTPPDPTGTAPTDPPPDPPPDPGSPTTDPPPSDPTSPPPDPTSPPPDPTSPPPDPSSPPPDPPPPSDPPPSDPPPSDPPPDPPPDPPARRTTHGSHPGSLFPT